MGKMSSKSGRIVVYILSLVLCAAAFLLIFLYIPGEGPSELDRAAGNWFAGMKNEGLTKVMNAAAFLGESLSVIGATLLLTIIGAWLMGIRKSLWITGGVAATYLINSLLKSSIARPRPDAAWGIEVDGFSFPSGNTMLAVALYGIFAIWMWNYGRISRGAKIAISWAGVLLILLICWSRLYFGVHYLTDIFAGIAVSGFIVILFVLVERMFGKTGMSR